MRTAIAVPLVFAVMLSACVNTPRHVEAAGFSTADQAAEFVPLASYFAKRLTSDQWAEFYDAFPEYWQDMQAAKRIGGSMEFHPWYTAYAFRWATLREVPRWDAATTSRLNSGQPAEGDSVMQLVYALGAPKRILWDSAAEVLIYANSMAYLIEKGRVSAARLCPGCSMQPSAGPGSTGGVPAPGMTDAEVRTVLGLRAGLL